MSSEYHMTHYLGYFTLHRQRSLHALFHLDIPGGYLPVSFKYSSYWRAHKFTPLIMKIIGNQNSNIMNTDSRHNYPTKYAEIYRKNVDNRLNVAITISREQLAKRCFHFAMRKREMYPNLSHFTIKTYLMNLESIPLNQMNKYLITTLTWMLYDNILTGSYLSLCPVNRVCIVAVKKIFWILNAPE